MIWLDPDAVGLAQAAAAIRDGELVIMPTETVYGLAGSALNPAAVRAIFEAKGRPSTNPLIVHIAEVSDLDGLVDSVPAAAIPLIEKYWPGPLTLVFRKSSSVPDEITAGGPTVAIRMPAHPVARALIRIAGVPVAAPSANRSMGLSPTRVEHLDPKLLEHVSVGLRSVPSLFGIESTVVDVTTEPPAVLRLGAISREALQLGLANHAASAPQRSPGQDLRHYAPRTPIRIVGRLRPADRGLAVGELTPSEYAAQLYHQLFQLDQLGLEEILIERVPFGAEWEAVRDRLARASVPES